MGQVAALKLAIDLFHSPARARALRSAALPEGIVEVIRVAADDGKSVESAARALGRSKEMVREAAEFYIEQVLLFPGADSYRVLGVNPDAGYDELRRNMALLLRWLHPDGGRHGAREVLASRVTHAWGHLKTQDRRDAYDRSLRVHASQRVDAAAGRNRPRSQTRKPKRRHRSASGSGAVTPVFDRRRAYDPVLARRDLGIFGRLLRLLFSGSVK